MRDIIPKTMSDVSVPKRNIIIRGQNVPATQPSVNNGHTTNTTDKDRIEKNPFFEKQRTKNHEQRKASSTGVRPIIWFLAVTAVLIAGFVVANYFSSATVDISPVTRSAEISYDLTAVKETKESELAFDFMSLSEDKTIEIPATIEKKIQKKASGKVMIYNSYNASPQRLIKNTRLESTDHKIFRVEESVVVPGAKVVAGKVAEPGSVEAIAYADTPGEEYNIGLTDFTIAGFKGDPRYTKFTARSKADSPMSGGFSGVVKVPSDEAIANAGETLKQELKTSAVEKARAQIPEGMTFFPGSMVLKFEEVPQAPTEKDTAKVSMRAIVSVFFFNTASLTQELTKKYLPEHKEDPFLVQNMSALTFLFLDPVNNVVLSDLTKIRFSISGNAVFVGKVDEKKIREELVGKDKKDFGKIIVGERNVGKAEAVIRPMWKTIFPDNAEKITIKITN